MAIDRFLEMFFEEARDLIQALEAGLMDLEARRDDRAHLDRTFRAAHTLKGAAGMVGLPAIAGFTHGVEAVLDRVRSGTLPVRPALISVLLEAKDHLAAMMDAAIAGSTIETPKALSDRLAALMTGGAEPEEETIPAVEPKTAGTKHYRIRLTPRPELLRRGLDPLGILDELRELGEAVITPDWERIPPLDQLEPRDCAIAWTIDLTTDADRSQLDEAFLFLDDPGQVVVEEVDDFEPKAAPEVAEPEAAPVAAATVAAAHQGGSRVRVDAEQLDQLVGMAGELAVLIDSLRGLSAIKGAGPWTGALEGLERVGQRLRDATLELRMVPVQELFVRLPRLVRDLAGKSGKRIELRVSGEETRLDRTIVERLAEPMLHLIRNAADHGLETPEERVAAGKPATATIRVGAGHEGDRVAVSVSDDGRGLDREKIAKKGIALGMIPPGTPADDPRVGELIFEAGFSTRDQASEISGRGVGLDVVRDAIRALRGRISLRSEPGKGTRFLLELPLSLAMIDGLLVESDGERFVVPMGQVEECVAIAPDALTTAGGRRAAVVRDELVPVLSPNAGSGPRGPGRELLLTRHAERLVGVAVDRLLGRVQSVIQPLDVDLAGLRRYSGATLLGDGSVCLVLDLATLVSETHAAGLRAAAQRIA